MLDLWKVGLLNCQCTFLIKILGYGNGPRLTSRFTSPTGIAIDANFDLYVSDRYEYTTVDGTNYLHNIRKISRLTGNVTTIAGGHTGNDNIIVKISPSFSILDCVDYSSPSAKSKLRQTKGSESSFLCLTDGPSEYAQFYKPTGLAVGRNAIFVADSGNNALRNISCLTGM